MVAFFVPHVVTAALIASYLLDQRWAFALPTWAFLTGLVIDQLFTAREPSTLLLHNTRSSWKLILYAWAPLHIGALLCGLHEVARLQQDTTALGPGLLSIAIGTAMVGGTLGGAIAHEFLHAPRTLERVIGTGLMSLISYGHFSIAHVAGHHRLVGTLEDPATARRGQTLYGFLVRSIVGGAVLAWRAECARLRRRRSSMWSIHNRLFQIAGWQALLYVTVYATLGWVGVAYFALQGLIGASLLEVMNYIMHYGLRRERLTSGRLEPVRASCSWNTRRLASTYLLCGIGLHSVHHCRPSKPFLKLTLPAAAPELPGGLLAMFVLAWFPPLWRSVMDPLADFWMRTAKAVARSAVLEESATR
jgi:alkane 1-monooxygenase